MLERILAAGPRGRLWSLVVLISLSVAAALQIPSLEIDRSDDRLSVRDDPGWAALERVQADFGGDQTVLIYLRAEDLWTEARLKQLQALTFALEDLAGVSSVDSLLSATNIRDKGEFVDAGPLMTIVPKDPAKLAELRDDALYSPLMRRNFISDDGHATAIALGYRSSPDPLFELELYQAIERRLTLVRGDFQDAFQIGRPRLAYELERGMRQDLERLLPAAFVVLVLVIVAFLRSLRVLPIPVVTSLVTILWTLGFMAAAGIPITLLTAIIPALIVVVGAVEEVHMIASYCEGIDLDAPSPRRCGIEHMARQLALPLFITALTTAVGFASNVITDIPLIFDFALASGFAMTANFVVTILAVPLMLHHFGPRQNLLPHGDEQPRGPVGRMIRVIEYLCQNASAGIMITTAILVGWFGHASLDVRVNNDPMGYFPREHALVRDAGTVHAELAGLHTFSVTLSAADEGTFATTAGLEKLARAQTLLDEQGLFDRTLSLATLVALLNQEYHAGDRGFHRIPDSAEELDLYLASLTPEQRRPFATADYRKARITVRHDITDSMRLNAAVDELMAVLPSVVGKDIEVAFTGKNLLVNRTAESLIDGQIASLVLILGVIFVIFSVLYTSWLAGLLALVPNLIPLVLNFGTMGLLGVPLNPGTAMVAAIAIGIGVDDTIHLMTRFGTESRQRVDENEAVRAALRAESVPVIASSVALAAGFATLGLSSFNLTAQFGLLAAATMLYAALAELLVTPLLLKHLRLATVWDIIALRLDREVLVSCPLFRGMTAYQVRKVVVLSHIEEFATNAVVIRQGTTSGGMYVILAGQAEVAVERDGIGMVVDRIGPGAVFGEVGFSGHGIERTATVSARSPLTVVRFDAESVRKGLRFYPGITTRLHRNISVVLGERLRESHERLLAAVQPRTSA